MNTEKDKNHKFGSAEAKNSGVIPFHNVTEYYNPGQIFEEYLGYLPGSKNCDTKLFYQPIQPSKKFSVLDPEEKTLYNINRPVGRNSISNMLPELCKAAGTPRYTNHQGKTSYAKKNFNPRSNLKSKKYENSLKSKYFSPT